MGAAGHSARSWSRRRAGAALLFTLGVAVVPVGLVGSAGITRAAADQSVLLFVSRRRLLSETDHARQLRAAEIDLTGKLQGEIDTVKAELASEEQELTRLRGSMDRKLFDARVAAFDHKVRTGRRDAQEKAAKLQMAFRAERVKLVAALDPLLEQLRKAHGASAILNDDQALAADPALDVTDEAIERFNATVPAAHIPDLESILASPLPPADGGEPEAATGQ